MWPSVPSSLVLGLLPIVVVSCTGGDPLPPANGGSIELAFSDTSGSNVDTSPVPATDLGLVFKMPETQTRVFGVFANEPAGNGFERKVWQLELALIGDVTAGATYTIGTTTLGSATLGYEESPEGGFLDWDATSGTITVDSLSGSGATLSFSAIPMAPSTDGSGNQATGTFLLDGTITFDSID